MIKEKRQLLLEPNPFWGTALYYYFLALVEFYLILRYTSHKINCCAKSSHAYLFMCLLPVDKSFETELKWVFCFMVINMNLKVYVKNYSVKKYFFYLKTFKLAFQFYIEFYVPSALTYDLC